MENDTVIEHWMNQHGCVTSYPFMIYGPMTVKDNAIINKGLTVTLIDKGYGGSDFRFVQLTEEVDVEAAEMYNINRGWNIQWVFPGELEKEVSSIITETIEEGLNFLRLTHNFLGVMGGKDYV